MIVNLLMRFYDIDSGKIMIDNQNLGVIARGHFEKIWQLCYRIQFCFQIPYSTI